MTRRARPLRRIAVAGLAAAIAACALARPAAADGPGYAIHAGVEPAVTPLGGRVTYRGWVIVPRGTPVRWVVPRTAGDFTWGSPVATRVRAAGGLVDTVKIDVPLQVFAFGRVSVPGMRMLLSATGAAGGPDERGLPVARMIVAPQIAPGDTSASLRAMRGPVAAPWWERVPWLLVTAVAGLLVALIALVIWLRRRRPRAVPKPVVVAAPPPPRRDPLAEALAELAALRRLGLPEEGRFSDHAFQLTRIVRRFLEAIAGGVRPGYTTSELVAMLAGASDMLDVTRLESLLRLWDFLKFARGSSTAAEAHQAETEVEAMLRGAVARRREVA